MMSTAPTRAVRQPGRRDLSELISGDIEGLRSVVDGMWSDAAFEQVRDRGVEKRQTSRADDCLPRGMRAARTGGIARSVPEHAARIERHGIEQVDDPASVICLAGTARVNPPVGPRALVMSPAFATALSTFAM